uniref:Uncharacterized protein n=1 Tax=Anguilla anguilla TaxID=7936 RepID=A0A0E9UQM8_ANGAN
MTGDICSKQKHDQSVTT